MEAQGMVERVARALADHIHENGDYGMSGEDAYASRPSEFEGMALAAIKAMREPTDSMSRIVREKCGGFSDSRMYRAFIDAAIDAREQK